MQNKYNNLTREEQSALYNLKNNKNIALKSADRGSAVVALDRDDYIKEAHKQLGDKYIYEEVCNDPGLLISTIVLIRVPQLLPWIGMIILKRLINNLEISIFMRRCVMILDFL